MLSSKAFKKSLEKCLSELAFYCANEIFPMIGKRLNFKIRPNNGGNWGVVIGEKMGVGCLKNCMFECVIVVE